MVVKTKVRKFLKNIFQIKVLTASVCTSRIIQGLYIMYIMPIMYDKIL